MIEKLDTHVPLPSLPLHSWARASQFYLRIVENTDELEEPDSKDLNIFRNIFSLVVIELIYNSDLGIGYRKILSETQKLKSVGLRRDDTSAERDIRNQINTMKRLQLVEIYHMDLWERGRLKKLKESGKAVDIERELRILRCKKHNNDIGSGSRRVEICGTRYLRELIHLVEEYRQAGAAEQGS